MEMTDKLGELVDAIKNLPKPQEMPNGLKMELPGVELITLKGEKGDAGDNVDQEAVIKEVLSKISTPKDGVTPTKSELLALITPLIPKVKDGEDADEQYIIEKVLERIPTPKDGDDGSPDTPEQIIEKINSSEGLIDKERIRGLDSYNDEIKTLQNRTQLLVQMVSQRTSSTGGTSITGIGTIDSVSPKVANGAQVSGANIILQTADASFPGLVSTAAQTFAGVKTFPGIIVTPTAVGTTDLILNGIASKSSPYFQALDSGSAVLATLNQVGFLSVGNQTQKLAFMTVRGASFTGTGTISILAQTIISGGGTRYLDEIGIGDILSVIGESSPMTSIVSISSNTSALIPSSTWNIGGSNKTYTINKAIARYETSAGVVKFFISPSGKVAIAPANLYTGATAALHIGAGTATAGNAPLKFTSGTNLSTTEAGAVEYDGSHLYFTATNAGTRFQLDQQAPSIGGTITGGTAGSILVVNPNSVIAQANSTLFFDIGNTAMGVGLNSKLSTLTIQSRSDFTATGTTATNASTTITGVGTNFLAQLGIDDRLTLSSGVTIAWVTAIATGTSATVSTALGDGTSQTILVKKSLFGLNDANSNRVLSVDPSGHLLLKAGAGTTSVAISAGTATLSTGSSDHAGKITATNTGVSIITITFANPFQNAPSAFAYNETTTSNIATVVTTTTTVVITCTTVTGDKITYGVIAS